MKSTCPALLVFFSKTARVQDRWNIIWRLFQGREHVRMVTKFRRFSWNVTEQSACTSTLASSKSNPAVYYQERFLIIRSEGSKANGDALFFLVEYSGSGACSMSKRLYTLVFSSSVGDLVLWLAYESTRGQILFISRMMYRGRSERRRSRLESRTEGPNFVLFRITIWLFCTIQRKI